MPRNTSSTAVSYTHLAVYKRQDLALAGLGNDAALLGPPRRAIHACEPELIDLTR